MLPSAARKTADAAAELAEAAEQAAARTAEAADKAAVTTSESAYVAAETIEEVVVPPAKEASAQASSAQAATDEPAAKKPTPKVTPTASIKRPTPKKAASANFGLEGFVTRVTRGCAGDAPPSGNSFQLDPIVQFSIICSYPCFGNEFLMQSLSLRRDADGIDT